MGQTENVRGQAEAQRKTVIAKIEEFYDVVTYSDKSYDTEVVQLAVELRDMIGIIEKAFNDASHVRTSKKIGSVVGSLGENNRRIDFSVPQSPVQVGEKAYTLQDIRDIAKFLDEIKPVIITKCIGGKDESVRDGNDNNS